MTTRKTISLMFAAAIVPLVIFVVILPASIASGQVRIAPGNVADGERVLQDKGCLSCHALNGRGGTRASDFATPSGEVNTPGLLAARMWNHSPAMFAEFETQRREVPKMSNAEAADLYAYFYASLFFAPRGDAARGQKVFEDKRCAGCHGDGLVAGSTKSLLKQWNDPGDPIIWAERMWNHTNEMLTATVNRGIAWPKLSERDVVDLLMYVSKTPDSMPAEIAFNVGDPGLGQAVFNRTCFSCHSFGTEASKIDLLRQSTPSSMTDYIAEMWNHAPEMRSRGGSTPRLATGDMRNLIAYLFSERYFAETGNVSRGQKVYESKNCVTCHETQRQAKNAPDLTQATDAFSPITLTASAWRHGPEMIRSMNREKLTWPQFKKTEMADLIAYLNSRIVRRIAK